MRQAGFPYGSGDRPPGARNPGGVLRALGALEYEIRCLPLWDVLADVADGDAAHDGLPRAAPG